MAAGTPPYIIEQTNYDPRTITLGDFIKLYETESTDVGGRDNSTWGNKIRKNAVYKDLLNEPVINILDATKQIDGKNIYKAAQDAVEKAKGDFQSKLRTIESNILPKIKEIQAREGVDLSRYTSLVGTAAKIPTRGAKLTAETQFDSNKMGELVANLEDHVKKNPTDRPSANAILLLLEMGARPSLPTEIISTDYVETTVTTEAEMLGVGVKNDGLHIPAERKGVKRQAGGQTPNVLPFNAPLSQRAITILQDQSRYNSENFGDNRRLDNFFQVENADGTLRPLELKNINDLLKIVTPPGTVRKLRDGKLVPTNNPLTSKNFRTIWTNIANTALADQAKIAALQSRDVGTNTGSVAVYLGQAGDYQPAAVADLNEISRKSWGLYTLRNEAGKLEYTKGNLLSTSTFLFDTSEGERIYEVYGRGQAANVPIQVGGFSAPRAAQSNTVLDTTGLSNTDRDEFAKGLFGIDWDNVGNKLKSFAPAALLTGAATYTVGKSIQDAESAQEQKEVAQDILREAFIELGLETAGKVAGLANIPNATVQFIMSMIGEADAPELTTEQKKDAVAWHLAMQDANYQEREFSIRGRQAGEVGGIPDRGTEDIGSEVGRIAKTIDYIPAFEVEEESDTSFFDMERIASEATDIPQQNMMTDIAMQDSAMDINRDEAPVNQSFVENQSPPPPPQ